MAGCRCDTDELLDNLYDYKIPKKDENFDTLLSHKNIKIVRIVSSADLEPTEYIQDEDEWVVVIKGKAKLTLKTQETTLKEGNFIFIPAKTPHTVLSAEEGTLWLAVHIF